MYLQKGISLKSLFWWSVDLVKVGFLLPDFEFNANFVSRSQNMNFCVYTEKFILQIDINYIRCVYKSCAGKRGKFSFCIAVELQSKTKTPRYRYLASGGTIWLVQLENAKLQE